MLVECGFRVGLGLSSSGFRACLGMIVGGQVISPLPSHCSRSIFLSALALSAAMCPSHNLIVVKERVLAPGKPSRNVASHEKLAVFHCPVLGK